MSCSWRCTRSAMLVSVSASWRTSREPPLSCGRDAVVAALEGLCRCRERAEVARDQQVAAHGNAHQGAEQHRQGGEQLLERSRCRAQPMELDSGSPRRRTGRYGEDWSRCRGAQCRRLPLPVNCAVLPRSSAMRRAPLSGKAAISGSLDPAAAASPTFDQLARARHRHPACDRRERRRFGRHARGIGQPGQPKHVDADGELRRGTVRLAAPSGTATTTTGCLVQLRAGPVG